MKRGVCEECKLNQNQKGITYICYNCEYYGICNCCKVELEKETEGKINE